MRLLAALVRWKARWVFLSGLFSVVVIPLVKFLLSDKKDKTSKGKGEIIDADFEEIKK